LYAGIIEKYVVPNLTKKTWDTSGNLAIQADELFEIVFNKIIDLAGALRKSELTAVVADYQKPKKVATKKNSKKK
jgi:hypothetical protein